MLTEFSKPIQILTQNLLVNLQNLALPIAIGITWLFL